MATHHQQGASPSGMHLSHHSAHPAHPQVNGHMPAQVHHKITPAHLSSLNESVWLGIGEHPRFLRQRRLTTTSGSIHEVQGDPDGALHAYEQALRHNSYSIQALNAISCILRTKENFPRAVEYLQVILKIDGNNGEVWGSLGTDFAPSSKALLTGTRPLFSDDGRLATSLCCLSASAVSSSRSKGHPHSLA